MPDLMRFRLLQSYIRWGCIFVAIHAYNLITHGFTRLGGEADINFVNGFTDSLYKVRFAQLRARICFKM